MYAISNSDYLHGAWLRLVAEHKGGTTAGSCEKARGLLCLLLNVDMVLKDYLCDPKRPELWRLLFNIQEPKTDKQREQVQQMTRGMHSICLLGCDPINHQKANLFFRNLSTKIVPEWLQDESNDTNELIRRVRLEYVHC